MSRFCNYLLSLILLLLLLLLKLLKKPVDAFLFLTLAFGPSWLVRQATALAIAKTDLIADTGWLKNCWRHCLYNAHRALMQVAPNIVPGLLAGVLHVAHQDAPGFNIKVGPLY